MREYCLAPIRIANPIAISLSFSDEMSCQSVSESLSLAYVIDPASSHQPRLNVNSATCTSIPPVPSSISSAPAAVWTWSSQIEDAPDGHFTN
ncbi:Cell wall alpha-1,3-glucan synthase ags1 [Puccinia graminis f. sp. tritici]|uniref:Cell wall alpha-1,3-glucan synthase ags1 n=1 Tax=Puccinia graminis f. sp. tritici TaxID=56615 RepID=A0A5B0M861_PUCGR|nr:Cell wall alpha-1,3-glucan synthase ags1 [Puccinia graminis f. sp. tritici]